MDPYLPSKPSASFLPTASTSLYQSTERYSPSSSRISQPEKASSETPKESKSTLSTLSDLDLIRKAEEELAAVAAATASTVPSTSIMPPSSLLSSPGASLVLTPPPIDAPPSSQILSSISLTSEPVLEASKPYKLSSPDPFKKSFASEQPKPPGLEDEDFPSFPSAPPVMDAAASRTKISKSGIVLNVKRKLNDDCTSPTKLSRTKSRWNQGPSE